MPLIHEFFKEGLCTVRYKKKKKFCVSVFGTDRHNTFTSQLVEYKVNDDGDPLQLITHTEHSQYCIMSIRLSVVILY
jgi:hypothetical protein